MSGGSQLWRQSSEGAVHLAPSRKIQEQPNRRGVISFSFSVFRGQTVDGYAVEHTGIEVAAASGEVVRDHFVEPSPQPLAQGHTKSVLALADGRGWQITTNSVAQDRFGLPAAQLQRRWQTYGELNKPVIEQRRAHFEAMGHTHSINLNEHVFQQAMAQVDIIRLAKYRQI